MSKPIHITDEILINYLLKEADTETTLAVEKWLSESESNLHYYNQFKEIWDKSQCLAPQEVPSAEEAWNRFLNRIHDRNISKPVILWRRLFSVAAILLLVFGTYILWPRKESVRPIVMGENNMDTITEILQITSSNISLIDTLSDQSVVTLNRKATLNVPSQFSSFERRVQLKGEAFFNIQPNKSKPFIIETQNDVEIKVLGTSFNVKAYADFTEVVVETGTVQLRKFDKLVILHANEMARIDNMDSTMLVRKTKDKLYKYYRSREFECDNTPLWKVVEVLNEAYEDTIVIENRELKKMPLTARFSNESLESVLNVLSETFEIKVEKKGNKYILK